MDTWDEAKRQKALAERGLDFASADQVFAGRHFTLPDRRADYGEPRYVTVGYMDGHFVVLVWTPRDGGKRIISMRHGHGKEEQRYKEALG